MLFEQHKNLFVSADYINIGVFFLEISNSTQNVDIKVDQTTELHGSGSGSRSGSGIFLPITLGLSFTILIVLIMTIHICHVGLYFPDSQNSV